MTTDHLPPTTRACSFACRSWPDANIGEEWRRRREQRRQRSDATVSLSRTTTTRTIIDTTTIAESEKNDDGGESGSGSGSGESGSGSGSSGVLFMAGALSGIAEAIVVQPFDMVKTPTSDQSGNESRSIQDAIAIAP